MPVLIGTGFKRVRATPEFWIGKDQAPITAGYLGLKVFRVAGMDASGGCDQPFIGAVQFLTGCPGRESWPVRSASIAACG